MSSASFSWLSHFVMRPKIHFKWTQQLFWGMETPCCNKLQMQSPVLLFYFRIMAIKCSVFIHNQGSGNRTTKPVEALLQPIINFVCSNGCDGLESTLQPITNRTLNRQLWRYCQDSTDQIDRQGPFVWISLSSFFLFQKGKKRLNQWTPI